MSQDITMFVLAAGLGSRYGGLKQMEGFGPNGETIIDYSIYDAIKAGFNKIVFVIRPDMEEAFREIFLHKYQDKINLDYCFQSVDMLPNWYERNPKRTKPWGTTHALLVSKELIDEPFIVINGDDFYGQESFEIAADFLKNKCSENDYAIVGYPLKNVIPQVDFENRSKVQICYFAIYQQQNCIIVLIIQGSRILQEFQGANIGLMRTHGTPWEMFSRRPISAEGSG